MKHAVMPAAKKSRKRRKVESSSAPKQAIAPLAAENPKRRKFESSGAPKPASRRSSRHTQPVSSNASVLTAQTAAVVGSNIVIDGIEPFEPTPGTAHQDTERAAHAAREVLPDSSPLPSAAWAEDEATNDEYDAATCPISMLLFALEDAARTAPASHDESVSDFIQMLQTALDADQANGETCSVLRALAVVAICLGAKLP